MNTALTLPVQSPVRAQPSARLLALMKFAKQGADAYSWRAVPQVLGGLYHPDMNLTDVMHHLVAAYEEALAEPRFELGRPSSCLDLILAPIKGFNSVEMFGPRSLDAAYSVEGFYDAMARHIFGKLSIARVDWMQQPLT